MPFLLYIAIRQPYSYSSAFPGRLDPRRFSPLSYASLRFSLAANVAPDVTVSSRAVQTSRQADVIVRVSSKRLQRLQQTENFAGG